MENSYVLMRDLDQTSHITENPLNERKEHIAEPSTKGHQ